MAVNVPTTWLHLSPALADFDNRMFGAINDMLLDNRVDSGSQTLLDSVK